MHAVRINYRRTVPGGDFKQDGPCFFRNTHINGKIKLAGQQRPYVGGFFARFDFWVARKKVKSNVIVGEVELFCSSDVPASHHQRNVGMRKTLTKVL